METVKELRDFLEGLDDDIKIYVSTHNGLESIRIDMNYNYKTDSDYLVIR